MVGKIQFLKTNTFRRLGACFIVSALFLIYKIAEKVLDQRRERQSKLKLIHSRHGCRSLGCRF